MYYKTSKVNAKIILDKLRKDKGLFLAEDHNISWTKKLKDIKTDNVIIGYDDILIRIFTYPDTELLNDVEITDEIKFLEVVYNHDNFESKFL